MEGGRLKYLLIEVLNFETECSEVCPQGFIVVRYVRIINFIYAARFEHEGSGGCHK